MFLNINDTIDTSVIVHIDYVTNVERVIFQNGKGRQPQNRKEWRGASLLAVNVAGEKLKRVT